MDLRWQIAGFDELERDELYALMRLRQQVFVVEQRCAYLDLDNLDQASIHMLCWRQNELLAYQRCLPPGLNFDESALGRIVVAPAGRGLQLGRELVQRGIDYNGQHWPNNDIQIGAQAHLADFYTSLGFVISGDAYIEDGIPHLHMIRSQAGK
jgi:ElaA protein